MIQKSNHKIGGGKKNTAKSTPNARIRISSTPDEGVCGKTYTACLFFKMKLT